MGAFIITRRHNGALQFNLKALDGHNILTGEGYSAKTSCLHAIEAVRKQAQEQRHFERKVSLKGKWSFQLKAANGLIIGTSEKYDSEEALNQAIASVMQLAPTAGIEDHSQHHSV